MLDRYRHDTRIMHINGDNCVNQDRTEDSYYFSKYMRMWGWASWRRAWQHYDYYMKSWDTFKQNTLTEQIFDDPYEHKYWITRLDQMYEDPQVIDTWDYQWLYACWSQGGLVIEPNKNLVSNIGFNRLDSTHCKGNDILSKLPVCDIWEIKHPPFIVRHREADLHSFYKMFKPEMREPDKFSVKLRRKIRHQLSLVQSKIVKLSY